MINILNLKLEKVTTTEIRLINKYELNGDQLKLNLSRRCIKSTVIDNGYVCDCFAELFLVDEEERPQDERSFYIKVALTGNFTCNEPQEEIDDERLRTAAIVQLLPHVRACFATAMTNAGLTPYIIPDSIIPELA